MDLALVEGAGAAIETDDALGEDGATNGSAGAGGAGAVERGGDPPAAPAPALWTLPNVSLDAWFAMRRIPGERRLGFRAWMRGTDGDRIADRVPAAWVGLWREYLSAPVAAG